MTRRNRNVAPSRIVSAEERVAAVAFSYPAIPRKRKSSQSAWFQYWSVQGSSQLIRRPGDWPPADASRFIRSHRFGMTLLELGERLLVRHGSQLDIAAGVATAFEWLERKAGIDRQFLRRFPSERRFEGYLVRMLFHWALKQRPSTESPLPLESLPDASDDPVERLVEDEFMVAAARAIENLPPQQQAIIKLRLIDGVSNLDASRQIGVPSYFASRLYKRGLANLALDLQKFS